MGEGHPRRLCHRHLGSTLLIFSVVQLWVLKNFTWGPLVGSGPGCVTRLVWKEKAFAAWSLVSASCSGSSQAPRSRPRAGVLCSDSARAPIPGFSWPTPTALLRLPLEEHLAPEQLSHIPPMTWTLWRLAWRSSKGSPCLVLVHRVSQCPHGWRSARPRVGPGARLLAQVHPVSSRVPALPPLCPLMTCSDFLFLLPIPPGWVPQREISTPPIYYTHVSRNSSGLKGTFLQNVLPSAGCTHSTSQERAEDGQGIWDVHVIQQTLPATCVQPGRDREVKAISPPRTLCRRVDSPSSQRKLKPSRSGVLLYG